ncbi:hypothetical protein [Kribbella ginsengisoli]|uniref:DUF3137 domain-containing protein n=1 Tax=Kribbella ginsengisoli TaxID=363865 RepID=A0ABP6Z6Z9_9ACTN
MNSSLAMLGLLLLVAITCLTFAGLIGLVVWVVRLVRQRRGLREEAMRQLGWVWVEPEPRLADVAAQTWRRGRPLSMAAGPYRGHRIRCLDYTYLSNDGTTTAQVGHLVALELPCVLPPITLTGDSRLLRILDGRDHEPESGLFNDAFRISCTDRRYASGLLHPRLVEFMLSNRWLDWRITGNTLISWSTGKWAPIEALGRLDALCQIAELIPNFLLSEYGRASQ